MLYIVYKWSNQLNKMDWNQRLEMIMNERWAPWLNASEHYLLQLLYIVNISQ